jgi:S-disulfanyl-L-cysteine oxidoreductase SoxD
MKAVNNTVISIFAVSAMALLGGYASAQSSTVKDGVYTAEQAASGKELYERRCGACHNVDFYRTSFTNRNNQPLQFMFEDILVNMPADTPGSMMDNEYEIVFAHILSLVGYPAGETALNYADGSMADISIVPPTN